MSNPDIFELYAPVTNLLGMLGHDPLGVVEQFATSKLEWIAVVATVACVALVARQNVLTWPIGLVGVVLYAYLFWDYNLFYDTALQVFFIPSQIVGWSYWLYLLRQQTGEDYGPMFTRTLWYGVRMKAFPVREPESAIGSIGLPVLLLIMGGGVLAAWLAVPKATELGVALPLWDGIIFWFSISAQALLLMKKWQSWVLWVAVDIIGIGVYSFKGLYPTAAMYGLLLLPLATYGLVSWVRMYLAQQEPAGRMAAAE